MVKWVSMTSKLRLGMIGIFALAALSGCAKNVDRIDFTKWGNSYVPRGSSVDTTAQGGVPTTQGATPPQSANHIVPKASLGGSYHRSFATSPSYKMVGGFHVGPSN
jgi:hypothetical protein